MAIFGAVLYTLNTYLHFYAHEARSYALVVLLSLLSSILFFNFIRNPKGINIFLLGLVDFLLIYTHYVSGLLIFFQFVFVLSFNLSLFRKFVLSLLVLSGLVFLRFTKKQFLTIFSFNQEGKSFWLRKADFAGLVETLRLFSGSSLLLIVFLILIVISLVLLVRRKNLSTLQFQVLIYSFLVGPLSVLALFCAGLFKPVFLDRYIIFCVPFFFILISWVIQNSGKLQILLFCCICGLQLYYYEFNPGKPMDYRSAAYIVEKLKSTDKKALVILQTKDIAGLFAYYYNRSYFVNEKNMEENLKRENIFSINTISDLKILNYQNVKTVILCQTYQKEEDGELVIKQLISDNYRHASSTALKGVKISFFHK
jgi:hypothetical protein